MFYLLNAELPLGLNPVEILLHLLNFAVLLVGVRFLFWKPIKKSIDKRQAEYKARENDTLSMQKEAEELKEKYDSLMSGADMEKAVIIKNVTADAKVQADNIINDAKNQAQSIIFKGRKTAESEADKIKKDMENQIADLSVSIAGKILDREITEKDNDKLIDECLKEWKKL